MNLSDYFSGKHGLTVAELRRAIGIKNDAQIWQWRHGHMNRQPDPANAVLIERATDGLVTRKDLRPNDWHLIWPELVTHPTTARGG